MYRDIITVNRNLHALMGKTSKVLLELFSHPEIIQNPEIAKSASKKAANMSQWIVDMSTALYKKDSG